MAAAPPQHELPDFVSTFTVSAPYFYFHHIINPDEATLTVEVIGPNLRFTFRHSRALEVLPRSNVEDSLQRKTVGFAALVRGTRRHIISWAESGHGAGMRGDFLDVDRDSAALSNITWTRRAIRMGTLLGFGMASPFDGSHRCSTGDAKGIFLGAHVEVKLSTHAIFSLLEMFDIATSFDTVTRSQLRKLRDVRWDDGTRPQLEIYISRKNCGRCGGFVRAVEQFTGIRISICWRDRLTRKTYSNHASKAIAAKARRIAIPVEDDQAIDLGDVIVIEDDDDSDLDREPIELDRPEEDAMRGLIDLVTPASRAGLQGHDDDSVDDFIQNMEAYAKKIDAANLRAPRPRATRRARSLVTMDLDNINKPIPATPVNEEPRFITPSQSVSVSGPRNTPRMSAYEARRARSMEEKRRILLRPFKPAVRERSPHKNPLRRKEKTRVREMRPLGTSVRGQNLPRPTDVPRREERSPPAKTTSPPRSPGSPPSPFDF